MVNPEIEIDPDEIEITRDDFDHLVQRASSGSEEAVAELRATLRANPATYRRLGDLARHIQFCLIKLIAKDSVVAHESLDLKVDELRSDLQGDGSSPLENLLIDQVVTSWLDLSFQRISFSQEHPTEAIAKRREQRLERAQKRHLAAVRALNDIRTSSRHFSTTG